MYIWIIFFVIKKNITIKIELEKLIEYKTKCIVFYIKSILENIKLKSGRKQKLKKLSRILI